MTNLRFPKLTVAQLATRMSRINRWSGTGAFALSIAQHQVLLCLMVPRVLRRAALIHDMSEAYMGGDVIAPIKEACPTLVAIEEDLQRAICDRFGVSFHDFAALAPYDVAIRYDERAALDPDNEQAQRDKRNKGLDIPVEPMTPEAAASAWLDMFISLFYGQGDTTDAIH